MLLLSEPIDFNVFPNVRPLCLPDPRPKMDVKAGVEVTVAGWGVMGGGQGQSETLQKATLQTVSNVKCRKAYPTYDPTSLQATHLCAYKGTWSMSSLQKWIQIVNKQLPFFKNQLLL